MRQPHQRPEKTENMTSKALATSAAVRPAVELQTSGTPVQQPKGVARAAKDTSGAAALVVRKPAESVLVQETCGKKKSRAPQKSTNGGKKDNVTNSFTSSKGAIKYPKKQMLSFFSVLKSRAEIAPILKIRSVPCQRPRFDPQNVSRPFADLCTYRFIV